MKQHLAAALAVAALGFSGAAQAQDEPKLTIGGTTYTKFLLGNQAQSGSLYNFTTVPGEGFGDNGVGSEVELLLDARLSRAVEVKARLHSRFSQNFWTNFGGFGGTNPPVNCTGGDCGEFDPRSNQYIKLRGVAVTLTPGYGWVDAINIGANDFGQFDPFVVGRIRYIDRDNAAGVLFQGSAAAKAFTYDLAAIMLPRLWAGPLFNTGKFTATDANYVIQAKYRASAFLDVGGLFSYANDAEINPSDNNLDNGRDLSPRYRNGSGGLKLGIHPSSTIDVRGQLYTSYLNQSNNPTFGVPQSFGATSGFSTMVAGNHSPWDAQSMAGKVNVDLNDPLGIGLSLFAEGFSLGANYTSIMAARRESDVLLTEGHDAAFAFPGPSNASYGVYGGNPTRIGYGGWDGTAQQVATLNVDNEFTDFDEPMAETSIGWKGVTLAPVFSKGPLEISGEYSYITYNTNWQAWGNPDAPVTKTIYPTAEGVEGVNTPFRSAFQPFQDKVTDILVLRAKYIVDSIGSGLEVFGKVKYIYENDKRMNDNKFLPFAPNDCPATPTLTGGCSGNRNAYNANGDSTADIFTNPSVITGQGGAVGYAYKPFDSLADDDRTLNYLMFNLGVGYQLTDDLYGAITYSHFYANLVDGNTAWQNLGGQQEMASGIHNKNQLSLRFKYVLAGAEIGAEGQYNFGTFTPDFGGVGTFVPQVADATISAGHNVPVGSLGFNTRGGGWQTLETRNFTQLRMKAYLKVQF